MHFQKYEFIWKHTELRLKILRVGKCTFKLNVATGLERWQSTICLSFSNQQNLQFSLISLFFLVFLSLKFGDKQNTILTPITRMQTRQKRFYITQLYPT